MPAQWQKIQAGLSPPKNSSAGGTTPPRGSVISATVSEDLGDGLYALRWGANRMTVSSRFALTPGQALNLRSDLSPEGKPILVVQEEARPKYHEPSGKPLYTPAAQPDAKGVIATSTSPMQATPPAPPPGVTLELLLEHLPDAASELDLLQPISDKEEQKGEDSAKTKTDQAASNEEAKGKIQNQPAPSQEKLTSGQEQAIKPTDQKQPVTQPIPQGQTTDAKLPSQPTQAAPEQQPTTQPLPVPQGQTTEPKTQPLPTQTAPEQGVKPPEQQPTAQPLPVPQGQTPEAKTQPQPTQAAPEQGVKPPEQQPTTQPQPVPQGQTPEAKTQPQPTQTAPEQGVKPPEQQPTTQSQPVPQGQTPEAKTQSQPAQAAPEQSVKPPEQQPTTQPQPVSQGQAPEAKTQPQPTQTAAEQSVKPPEQQPTPQQRILPGQTPDTPPPPVVTQASVAQAAAAARPMQGQAQSGKTASGRDAPPPPSRTTESPNSAEAKPASQSPVTPRVETPPTSTPVPSLIDASGGKAPIDPIRAIIREQLPQTEPEKLPNNTNTPRPTNDVPQGSPQPLPTAPPPQESGAAPATGQAQAAAIRDALEQALRAIEIPLTDSTARAGEALSKRVAVPEAVENKAATLLLRAAGLSPTDAALETAKALMQNNAPVDRQNVQALVALSANLEGTERDSMLKAAARLAAKDIPLAQPLAAGLALVMSRTASASQLLAEAVFNLELNSPGLQSETKNLVDLAKANLEGVPVDLAKSDAPAELERFLAAFGREPLAKATALIEKAAQTIIENHPLLPKLDNAISLVLTTLDAVEAKPSTAVMPPSAQTAQPTGQDGAVQETKIPPAEVPPLPGQQTKQDVQQQTLPPQSPSAIPAPMPGQPSQATPVILPQAPNNAELPNPLPGQGVVNSPPGQTQPAGGAQAAAQTSQPLPEIQMQPIRDHTSPLPDLAGLTPKQAVELLAKHKTQATAPTGLVPNADSPLNTLINPIALPPRFQGLSQAAFPATGQSTGQAPGQAAEMAGTNPSVPQILEQFPSLQRAGGAAPDATTPKTTAPPPEHPD